jgi:hypothetical protein
MSKKVSFGATPPASKAASNDTDGFVSSFAETSRAGAAKAGVPAPDEKTARVTVEIPATLHRRFKAQAAQEGHKIADLVREWVEQYLIKAQM